MKRRLLIPLIILLFSCQQTSRNKISDITSIQTEYSCYLEILLNREMTNMTMPFFVDESAERHLEKGDLQSLIDYNILKSLSLRQAGNYSEAYDYLYSAQELSSKLNDDYSSEFIWLGKYLMSQYMHNYQRAVEESMEMAGHFQRHETRYIDYPNYLLEAIRSHVIIGKYEKATAMMLALEPSIAESFSRTRYKYYDTWLNIYRKTDCSRIDDILEIIFTEIPPSSIHWLNIAYTYYLTGRYDDAEEALENYRSYNSRFANSTAYWGVGAHIMEGMGRKSEALQYLKRYQSEVEKEYLMLLESGILHKEQEMMAEMERMKSRHVYIILGLSILALLLLSIMIYIVLKHRLTIKQKEVTEYSSMAARAEEEVKKLQILYDNKTLDKNLRNALSDRIAIFNKLILGKMIPNYRAGGVDDELKDLLKSTDTFLESTCRTFEALHPEFASYLAGCNLTERERGCCCLYCMGMKGNEIAAYMGLADRSYYNFSSTIRKKLGLTEYKTNLDFYLRSKLNELDS